MTYNIPKSCYNHPLIIPQSCHNHAIISPESSHNHPINMGDVFLRIFFVFQSGAVFLAICYILGLKSLICVLFAAFWSQNLWFVCYLLHFGAKISLICDAICSISELKSQIWVSKIVNLHDNCNIIYIYSFHPFSHGFQRYLDGFHRFLDRLQWSFRGFKHSVGFLLGFLRV